MIPALLLMVSLQLGSKGPDARFQAGQNEFNRGNFNAALRQLDAASAEAKDEKLLGQIHLLRGQAYAAKGDYDRAEAAFLLALEADPEARLDPARVDPRLVGMLDGVRERLTGKLTVGAPVGTKISVDGHPMGVAPLALDLPIGHHLVEGRSPDGRRSGRSDVVLRSKKTAEVELAMAAASPRTEGKDSKPEGKDSSADSPQGTEVSAAKWGQLQPFADLRPAWAPAELLSGLGFEVGGGVEREWVRVQLSARLVQYFGITPRAAFHIPVLPKLEGLVEGEVPFLFPSTVAIGVGAAGGAEYAVIPWVGAFAQVGFRYYFVHPDNYPQNQFLLQLGVRLRLPH